MAEVGGELEKSLTVREQSAGGGGGVWLLTLAVVCGGGAHFGGGVLWRWVCQRAAEC